VRPVHVAERGAVGLLVECDLPDDLRVGQKRQDGMKLRAAGELDLSPLGQRAQPASCSVSTPLMFRVIRPRGCASSSCTIGRYASCVTFSVISRVCVGG
jgi:hypothetical protein